MNFWCRFFIAATLLFGLGTRIAHPGDLSVVGASPTSESAPSLSLAIEDADFDWPIIIRRNDSGETPIEVRVDVTPLIGPSARPANNLKLAIDGESPGQTRVDLPSLGQAVVRLSGKLGFEGAYHGEFGVIEGDRRIPYALTVTRTKPVNPVKLSVVGAGSDGRLSMASDQAAVTWPIVLRRDDTNPGDVDVDVTPSALMGPSGVIAPTWVTGKDPVAAPIKAVKLGPLGEATVQLHGKAAPEGAYTGEIAWTTAGVRSTTPLSLTRTHPDFDLKVDPISNVRGEASLEVRIQNLAAEERAINRPYVARLERVDASGSEPVNVGVAGYRVTYASPDGKSVPDSIVISPDGGLDLRVDIGEVSDPGRYKGALRFTAADRKPLDASFEFALRLPWLWPAIAIALGAIVAAVVRYLQQTAQPRLALQRVALTLRGDLMAFIQAERSQFNDEERKAIDKLLSALDAQSDALATGGPTNAIDAALKVLRRQLEILPKWVRLRRRIDVVRPTSVADALRSKLGTAAAFLNNPTAKIEDADAILKTLDDLDAEINIEDEKAVTAACVKITKKIKELPLAEQPDYAEVVADAQRAEDAAKKKNLNEAVKILDRARSSFALVGARLLKQRLSATTTAFGFSMADWAALRETIVRQLDAVTNASADPQAREEAWLAAYRSYLGAVIDKADAWVANESIGGSAHDKLGDARQSLAADDLGAARKAYEEAVKQAVTVPGAVATARAGAGAPTGEAPAPGGAGASLDSVLNPVIAALFPLPVGREANLGQITRWQNVSAVVLLVVMMGIAILTGLQLLYWSNPTYGFSDLTVAFLWGAGLQAVAGQAFQGLQGLAQQLR